LPFGGQHLRLPFMSKPFTRLPFALPSPFGLALGITALVVIAAFFAEKPAHLSGAAHFSQLVGYWYAGVWDLLGFTMQMVLILVLGHVIALSPLVSRFIDWFIARFAHMGTALVAMATATALLGLVNWGLSLVFGAVLARKLAVHAHARQLPCNYPLMGAAGYVGLMVWHGGLSGSAPLTVAAPGHFLAHHIGVVSTASTIFSVQNIAISCVIVLAIALTTYFLSRLEAPVYAAHWQLDHRMPQMAYRAQPAVVLFGLSILAITAWQIAANGNHLSAINLNMVNFVLLGLALIFMGNIKHLEMAGAQASQGAFGIMVQFPLYAGIIAIMTKSGLLSSVAAFFIDQSTAETFPILTYLSAALINLAVPSGGGQWAVQGPLVVQAAQHLGASVPESIMALAYGDQITNMIQPFWALPLLAITRLRAVEILRYSAWFMVVGAAVYFLGLWWW
jgi:short-chain fatty acids transporter